MELRINRVRINRARPVLQLHRSLTWRPILLIIGLCMLVLALAVGIVFLVRKTRAKARANKNPLNQTPPGESSRPEVSSILLHVGLTTNLSKYQTVTDGFALSFLSCEPGN